MLLNYRGPLVTTPPSFHLQESVYANLPPLVNSCNTLIVLLKVQPAPTDFLLEIVWPQRALDRFKALSRKRVFQASIRWVS